MRRGGAKKNAELAVERDAEVERIAAAVAREGRVDLEAVEQAVRAAVLAAGGAVLGELLRNVGVGRRDGAVRCSCGTAMQSCGVRTKRIQTLLGWVPFARSMYRCPKCGQVRCPGDEGLDVVNTSRSPGVRRQTARLGAKESFAEVSADMAQLAGLELCRKEAERIAEAEGARMEQWMAQEHVQLRFAEPPPDGTPKTIETLYIELDGTGIPMVPGELEGRKGKQPDGTAKTREAKVGCVFTQTRLDEKGKPVRDPGSASFVAAIEAAGPFGWRLYAEAVRRGLFQARRVVVLGDGAEWVKNTAQTHFCNAQFIVDYYHASEHVGDLCRALLDRNPELAKSCRERWTDYLWEGQVERVMEEASALLPKDPAAKKGARTQIDYFRKNTEHMRYGLFRKKGLFVGSGVIEAACRQLVGLRLKQSGMEWTERGANSILALRAVVLSNRMEEYWEGRAVA